jgi:hypothetical protein
MKAVGSIVLVGCLVLTPLALAQGTYVPALGDIMSAVQSRHTKLWFAGRLKNWDLASFELEQMRQELESAATLYSGIPAEFVGATVDPIKDLGAAITAKDGAKFASAYSGLNGACNACHKGINRGFIVIQVPSTSPFGDQSFAPPR